MPEREQQEFEKQVIELPDGRRLIYYWFTSGQARPQPASPLETPREDSTPSADG